MKITVGFFVLKVRKKEVEKEVDSKKRFGKVR
jgi:hypothetical protein